MASIKIPEKWTKSEKQIQTTQISFEFDQMIERQLKQEALESDHSPSTQLRIILGLPVGTPIRRRISVSLSAEDKKILSQRYNIDINDNDIMRAIIRKEITKYFAQKWENTHEELDEKSDE